MFKLSFESATFAGLMAAVAEAANSHGGNVQTFQPNTGNAAGVNSSGNGPGVTHDPDAGPVNVNAPSLDQSGLPWDERIHAATKATVADGTWRKKRGVDAGIVANIEMELRNKLAAHNLQQQQNYQQPVQQQFQQPNVQQQQQPPFNPNGGQQQPNVQPQQFQQFDTNGQPIQPGNNFQPGNFQQPNTGQQQQQFNPNGQQQPNTFQAPQLDFAGLMQAISVGMAGQTIHNNDIAALCGQIGVANIAMLQNDPARVQAAVGILRQAGKIQ